MKGIKGMFRCPRRFQVAGGTMGRCVAPPLVILVVGCGAAAIPSPPSAGPDEGSPTGLASDNSTIRHATGFSMENVAGGTRVIVHSPWQGAERSLEYLVVDRESAVERSGAVTVIRAPALQLAATSTTVLSGLEALGVIDRLAAFSSPQWAHNPAVQQRYQSGRIAAVGEGADLNVEKLVEISPDLLLSYTVYGDDLARYRLLSEAGIPVLFIADHLERHPLGRAEWVRLLGLVTGQTKRADEWFAQVERNYQQLADRTRNVRRRPKVLVGNGYRGTWHVPGGASYMAWLLEDAGADYPWKESASTGMIPLNVEAVFERAGDADLWINTGTWTSIAQARADDERYTRFACLAEGRVFNNNKRVNASGGNDYFETGLSRPDLLLADLVRLFHPEMLSDHELIWYAPLPENPP